MPITSLGIHCFRNLSSVQIFPEPLGINLFYGENGSGKTSVLEAIYYLGLGRSFRSSLAARLIMQNMPSFSVTSQIMTENKTNFPLGVARQQSGTNRFRIAEKDVQNIAELATHLPIRLINSQSHQLFEAGPSHRRKYLDWGLFYTSEQFLACWRQYERVLKQRNAILKEKRPKKELSVWDTELIKFNYQLTELRQQYIQALIPLISEMFGILMVIDPKSIGVYYQPGWKETMTFESALEAACQDDYRVGYTQFGAHRADLDICIEGVSAKHFLSRGQQKLLICAMILAQGMLLGKHNKNPIYLVDDLPSELDKTSAKKLISLLTKQASQVFMTAIERQMVCEFLGDLPCKPLKVFHVEHGSVIEMAQTKAPAILGV